MDQDTLDTVLMVALLAVAIGGVLSAMYVIYRAVSGRAKLGAAVGLVTVYLLGSAAAVVGLAWMQTTERLDFQWEARPAQVGVGGHVTIVHGQDCDPDPIHTYRSQYLDRWQHTHTNGALDTREIWDLDDPEYFETLGCATKNPQKPGRTRVRLPVGLEPGRVALCSTGGQCAEVTVVRQS